MKRILFTAIYPFWFFLAKTWLGGMMMIAIVLMPIPILISIILPNFMNTTGEEAKGIGIGIGIGILSLICSPFTAGLFVMLSDRLQTNYKKWNYKIKMETEMI